MPIDLKTTPLLAKVIGLCHSFQPGAEDADSVPGRPTMEQAADAFTSCGGDEERARALLIERGHAREYLPLRLGGPGGVRIDIWVPADADQAAIEAAVAPVMTPHFKPDDSEGLRQGHIRAMARAVLETVKRAAPHKEIR